jgi:hypothetical protein
MIILILFYFIQSIDSLMPTLFIPGIGGSRLVKNGIEIWPPDIKYLLMNPEKYKNIIKYDKELKTFPFGHKNSIDIYSPYMKLFVKEDPFHKIQQIPNIHMIPYDFRLVDADNYISEFNKKLKQYIEELDVPIRCIAHSTGGLLFHYFLYCQNPEWKKKYIHHVYNVNVPFTGTIMSLQQVIQLTLYHIIAKDILFSFGGIILNFPRNRDILTVDGELTDYIDYFKIHEQYEIYNRFRYITNTFSIANDVKTTIVYSTTSSIITPIHIKVENGITSIIYGEGDGIVPLESILYCKTWSQPSTEFVHIKNTLHSDILYSNDFLNLL